MSTGAISRALTKLAAAGVIVKETRNKHGHDRTCAYRVAAQVYDELQGDCIYFDPHKAAAHGLKEALILGNLHVRFRASEEAENERAWIVLRPKDLSTRLGISENSVRRALARMVPAILEQRWNEDERCTEYRPLIPMPGQVDADPFVACEDCRLIPEAEWGTSPPFYPTSASRSVEVSESERHTYLAIADALNRHFRQSWMAAPDIRGNFALAVRTMSENGLPGFFNLILEHRSLLDLRTRVTSLLHGVPDAPYLCDLACLFAAILLYPSFGGHLKIAFGAVPDNGSLLKGFHPLSTDLGAHALKRRTGEIAAFVQAHQPSEASLMARNEITPAEKTRVVYAVINYRLRYGVWPDGYWARYRAEESPAGCKQVYDFFRRNRETTPEVLLALHERCQEFEPMDDDSEEYDHDWHARRGTDLGFLVENLDTIAKKTGFGVASYCQLPTKAPGGRLYAFDQD